MGYCVCGESSPICFCSGQSNLLSEKSKPRNTLMEVKDNMKRHDGYWKLELMLMCPNVDCLGYLPSDCEELTPGEEYDGEIQCPDCGEIFKTKISKAAI